MIDRNSFGESSQESISEKISTKEFENPSHKFLGNTQSEKSEGQSSHNNYERMGDVSESQAQLYFSHKYLQSNAYNVAYFDQFHGRLDVQKLSWALRLVSKRHEALRSAYFIDVSTSRPGQAVMPEPNVKLIHKFEAKHGDEQFQTQIERVKEVNFDIEDDVVMKVAVSSHTSSLHSIIFHHHHIALDGVSWSIFVAELAQTYSAGLNGIKKSISAQHSIDMVKRKSTELAINN
ncbi:BcPKS7, polyketide synthase, partial sequence [Botrytis cinerea T4]|uniref:BcPKS7, polyketide synthase, partial sequence n=1 Tax=Botryotinia fuckeliana (strain T4) TaxID=999810 RepID=G2XPS6_BOTF4